MKNVLAGIGIGAAIGMLIAPEPGRGLRGRLQDRAARIIPDLRKTASELGSDGRDEEGKGILQTLNTATREDLLSVYGLGTVVADQIVQNRPFSSERQLIERNVVPESNFDHLKRQLQQKRTA